ncbi:VPLPA-CTERM sorting domain-containing protein [Methylophilus aquaticus]|uniref:VPLPA-CTERM sorting domain-containing protein n=1 Tax=Methylophilus aquaticus TaxID=1971610 RepID=A0ABT9JSM4_9PROT|nr:VPLPA-CTERM sorting domain-containing protein [Methylophilus aquaticus]MDP8567583.1 VPLPA-CTERM sorting domain-containing protein [Methylophilus aquaticus]
MHPFFKSLPIALALSTGLLANHAQATPVTWTFSNDAKSDPASVPFSGSFGLVDTIFSGSFVYDADLGKATSVNFSFTDTSSTRGTLVATQVDVDRFNSVFNNSTGEFYYSAGLLSLPPLQFASALTNAGGTINIVNGTGSISSSSTVSAVPIPAAAWLFGSGVLGFAGLRRKKTV